MRGYLETKRGYKLKNLLLIATSILLSLLLAELVVRWAVPLREVGPVLSIQDGQVGKRLRPNVQTIRKAPEFIMEFSTNSEGFRGPEQRGFANPILFLGDSFTMGYGVSDGAEYPAVIQHILAGRHPEAEIEVINAGIGDNGNGQWIKFLRLYLHEIDPSLVVLQFSQNDFSDNARENYFAILENGDLLENEIRISLARRIENVISIIPGLSDSHLYAAARQARYYWGVLGRQDIELEEEESTVPGIVQQRHDVELPYSYRLTRGIVSEAVRICISNGYSVVAVIVGLDGAELEMTQSWFGGMGVPTIAIQTKATQPEYYFQVDGHWNEKGHQHVAHEVAQLIDRELSR